jgi:hypothetical protein
MRNHFIRQAMEEREVHPEFVISEEQLADILTKALPKERFKDLRAQIGMCLVRT